MPPENAYVIKGKKKRLNYGQYGAYHVVIHEAKNRVSIISGLAYNYTNAQIQLRTCDHDCSTEQLTVLVNHSRPYSISACIGSGQSIYFVIPGRS